MTSTRQLRRILCTCGNNDFGQLGLGTEEGTSLFTAVLGLADVDIASVSTGAAHTAAVSTDGSVYTFGSNVKAQLGEDSELLSRPVPGEVDVPDSCKSVHCGSTFTLALTSSGEVWSEPPH